ELHGAETDETELVFWDAYNPDLITPNSFSHIFPRNHNGTNSSNNWVQLTGPPINYLATSSVLDVKQWSLGYSNVSTHKWIGLGSPSYPGDWSLPGHWEGGAPQAGDSVLIPAVLPDGNSGYPYRNLLPVIAPASAKSIEIESGAILISDAYDITVSGSGDAWVNNGVFTPGTGTVIFNHGAELEAVNIFGTTSFNNLTVEDKTYIKAATNSIIRIAGTLSANSRSILDFTANANTVEYNGAVAQTVVNSANATTPGYHHLIFSGAGTKTLPAVSLSILGDLTSNASISAIGNTLVMSGSIAQNISGTVALDLNNLTISNATATVTAGVNMNCSGIFTNSSEWAELDMTTYSLAVSGIVSNSGTVKTASISSTPFPSGKTWGGTVQYYASTGGQTVMAGTYDKLSLSNTTGTQSANGSVTVNGTLTTTSGARLDMGTNQLLGTLSSITNGGTIQTQNTSATPIPTGKIWGGTVQYNAANGGQTVMAGTYATLMLSHTSGTQTASGAIAATTLNTALGGVFNLGTYALSGLTTVSNLGTLRTQNTSSTPFTSGLSWGGTMIFDGAAAQTLPSAASTFNNLSISNTAGVTAATSQTVNGILNLSVANPDATHGSIDMTTDTLFFGANANTIGIGDVTGIITRTSFVVNTTYTYGNKNQYVFFTDVAGQTLPTSVSVRVSLLSTAPTWVANATKRLYDIAQTGGANTKATFRTNYLDTELASGVDESVLTFWQNADPYGLAIVSERGWSDYNSEENWLSFSDANFGLIPQGFGGFLVNIAPTQVAYRTWNGSQSTTEWNTATNWSPQGVPTGIQGVLIPDVASSNSYSPDMSVDAIAKYLIIQNGGILNAVTNASITLWGSGNVWSIEAGGVFNAGNSNVLFVGDTAAGVVRASGTTDFYDLTIADSTAFLPGVNAYIGISGTLTNNGILDAAIGHNTIEFKKNASFTLPSPNGSTPGYNNLIISGTGTKTLPASLNIWHDFTNNGTVAAGTGCVTFNGLHNDQIIGGTSSTAFYDLTIANTAWEVTTAANFTVSHNLTVNANAILNPGSTNTIGGVGTLTGYGELKVSGLGAINSLCTQYAITTKDLTKLTVDYIGAGDQTVCAANYGDLIISPNGTRTVTLASSGVIGVNGLFETDNTVTDYIVTGSTMNANGTGAQIVHAFNYYNVIISGDRGGETITLINGGTIGIAGDGSVTATNVNFDITNNTIDINGSGAQNLDKFSFYYLKISNSGIKTALDSLTVYAGFTIDEGLTLDMAAYPLLGSMGTISNSGILKTSNTAAAPIPSGKIWDGNVEYSAATAQTVAMGTYQNLTMSGAGGGTTNGDVTVNGILNLSHVNPLSTKGILHTSNDTLFMEASATTIGVGDVTGIVKRQHPFTDSVDYSFGNKFTSLNFRGVPGGVKPTWVACKIVIGSAPTWRSEAINRNYSFAQSGGTDRMIVKLHYLDSELHDLETDESQLVFWDAYNSDLVTPNSFTDSFPRNNNGTDTTDNWVQLTGSAINYLATSSILDVKQWSLAYTNVDTITWIGLGSPSYPGDWSLPGHWNGGVPGSDDDVLIDTLPVGSSGYPYRNLLPVIAPSMVKTLKIDTNGTLTLNDFDITISGDANAWVNNGTFNPRTSAVIFNNGNTSNAVAIAGTTNFYDVSVSDNTKIQAATDNVLEISGTLSMGSGSILDFSSNVNTVVYNGNDSQSILNPTGGTSLGYYHLTLNANGTKVLPTSLNVLGDFTINSDMLYSGNTTVMSGTLLQTIGGSSSLTFNNLTIDNAAGVAFDMDQLCTVRGTLHINVGKKMQVAAGKHLTLSGSLSNDAGVAGLVLQSSTSGTASLLHETDDVPATVERMITGAAEDWHFLSSPVADETISGDWLPTGTYGNGTGYDMYLWNEPSNCWIYQHDSTSTVNWTTAHPSANFVAGKGYLYSIQATTPTKEFVGNLNNDDVTYALTIDGSADLTLQGFNLVGNPYSSSIDWMASSGWYRDMLATSGSNSGNDMWIWNPTAGNYGVCNSATGDGTNSVTRYIAPMQGFFVRAESAGNMVSTNNVRVHDATTLWKSARVELSRITAVVSSESDKTSDELRLLFGYPENNAGAAKLFSPLVTAPSLYSPEGDANFSIRYLSDTISNPNVPVSFKAGRDGEYSINFDFNSNDFEIVILEDLLTNEFVDLTRVADYRFKASTT
nr:hypothetical protein [Bacteroidales bacterium]